MPRNSQIWLALFSGCGVLAGCGSREPAIFVDLSRAPEGPVIAWQADVGSGSTPSATQLAIEAIPPTLLGRTSDSGSDLNWEAELARQREESYARTQKILEKRLLARARADEAAQLSMIEPLRAEIMIAAYEKSRVLFEQYAEPIGVLRVKLANRVGVPTPESNFPRVRRPWYPATDAEVKELKRQIEVLEAAYRRDLGGIIDQASAEADRLIATARLTTVVREDEALREARARVDELRRQAKFSPTSRPVVGSQERIGGVLGASVTTSQAIPRVSSRFDSRSDFTERSRQALKNEAFLWAKRNGWRLVENASEGRDKTADFWKWRAKFHSEPSPN